MLLDLVEDVHQVLALSANVGGVEQVQPAAVAGDVAIVVAVAERPSSWRTGHNEVGLECLAANEFQSPGRLLSHMVRIALGAPPQSSEVLLNRPSYPIWIFGGSGVVEHFWVVSLELEMVGNHVGGRIEVLLADVAGQVLL